MTSMREEKHVSKTSRGVVVTAMASMSSSEIKKSGVVKSSGASTESLSHMRHFTPEDEDEESGVFVLLLIENAFSWKLFARE